VPDEVLRLKAGQVRRAVGQVRSYMAGEAWLDVSFLVQDAVSANLQRACESAIDGALRLMRMRRLGVVRERRDAFITLARAECLPVGLAERLTRMVAFRNALVHTYDRLDPAVVQAVLDSGLDDLLQLAERLEREAASP